MIDWSSVVPIVTGGVGMITGIIGIVQSHQSSDTANEANKLSEETNRKAEEANKISGYANKIAEEANIKAEEANLLAEKANNLALESNEIARDQYMLNICVNRLTWYDPDPEDFVYKNVIDLSAIEEKAKLSARTFGGIIDGDAEEFNIEKSSGEYVFLELSVHINCAATIQRIKITDFYVSSDRFADLVYSQLPHSSYIQSAQEMKLASNGIYYVPVRKSEDMINVCLPESGNIMLYIILPVDDKDVSELKEAVEKGYSYVQFDMELTTISGISMKASIWSELFKGKKKEE